MLPQDSELSDKVGSAPVRMGDSYCTFCGTLLNKDNGGSPFCPKCGYRPMAQPPAEQKTDEEDKRINWSFWLKIVLYILLGAMSIYMVMQLSTLADAF